MSSRESPETSARLNRALVALNRMEAKLDAEKRARCEPIAIVGIGCRFPGGADSPDRFWQLLHDRVDAVGGIPSDREELARAVDADPEAPGKSYSAHGGFVDGLREFDAPFFNISPREAASLDPQQRLVLEVAWEAIEDAGIAADTLAASATGVFVGACGSDYWRLLGSRPLEAIDAYLGTGIGPSVIAGRLSFMLGLQGPSLSMDTACSSSLVAVHLACQALRAGEANLALAGGVQRLIHPDLGVAFSKARMLSPDGRCRAFDGAANGFVRAEGCGFVVLKRWSDAQASRDAIYAVILGSAVNQDGRTSGLTVPNGPAQQALIRTALTRSNVRPDEVSYVEAHGTGTALGDPIEMAALAAVFGGGREAPLYAGSLKTNIGHLEAAAGIAGLIKVALSLDKREMPAQIHFENPNPRIPWSSIPIEILTQERPWAGVGGRQIAGVSSFGFSGTNAHVVLEAVPREGRTAGEQGDARSAQSVRTPHVLTLSAKSAAALESLRRRYLMALGTGADPDHELPAIGNFAYTTNVARAQHGYRAAIVASSRDEARLRLRDATWEAEPVREVPPVVFLYDTDGDPWITDFCTLWASEPAFRAALEPCEAVAREVLGVSLASLIASSRTMEHGLDATYAQPALYMHYVGLTALWQSWGVAPSKVAGRGVGEYAAAVVEGIVDAAAGMRLVIERASLERYGRVASMSAPPIGGAEVQVRIGPASERALAETVARLWARGVPIDFAAYHAGTAHRRVRLPTYPFDRSRHWVEVGSHPTTPCHPFVGRRRRSPSREVCFEAEMTAASPWWVADHAVNGQVVAPAAAYVDAMLSAGRRVLGGPVSLHGLTIPRPLVLGATPRDVQCLIDPDGDDRARIRIASAEGGGDVWDEHAAGRVERHRGALSDAESLSAVRARMSTGLDVDALYAAHAARRIHYGPAFRTIDSVWTGEDEALGVLRAGTMVADETSAYAIHPAMLDGAFQMIQAIGAMRAVSNGEASSTWLPIGIEQVEISDGPIVEGDRAPTYHAHVRRRSAGLQTRDLASFDVSLYGPGGALCLRVSGLSLKRLGAPASRPDSVYEVSWVRQSAVGAESEDAPFAATPDDLRSALDRAVRPHAGYPVAELERLTAAFAAGALSSLGWPTADDRPRTLEQARRELGIPERQGRLLRALLEGLAAEGWMSRHGDDWAWCARRGDADAAALASRIAVEHADCAAVVCVVRRCGESLRDVLAGKVEGVDVLFPGGDSESVASIYRRDSATSGGIHDLVEDAILEAIGGMAARGEPVRILEVGAGTGGTTRGVLTRLSASGVDFQYVFTDVAPSFVVKARHEFREWVGFEPRVLDIEKLPAEHEFGRFDIVIASNVLHATSDVRRTIGNVRRLLKPRGLLFLQETTVRRFWLDIVFGLLPGWWAFTDTELREHALMSSERWERALRGCGFESTAAVSPPGMDMGGLAPQSLVVAKASEERTPIAGSRRGTWLLVGEGDMVASLSERLARAGTRARIAFALSPEIVESAMRDDGIEGVVHFARGGDGRADELAHLESTRLLTTVRALLDGAGPRPALWIVTRGAQAVGDGHAPLRAPGQSVLWGMARTIEAECPELPLTNIDLEPDSAGLEEDLDALEEALLHGVVGGGEPQRAVRAGRWYAARLIRSEVEPETSRPVALTIEGRGTVEGLRLEPIDRPVPSEDEVEVRVTHAGLNFIDVMDVLGVLPFERAGGLGAECVGQVVRVGAHVTNVAVGDRVIAMAPNAFASHVVVNAALVAHAPRAFSDAAAATLPISFLTAVHALERVAALRPGERVLIHSAGGGTGLAAVQIAIRAGAIVYATAGRSKWPALRRLGVTHLFASRSLDFADHVRRAAGERGVDVVLNALTGEFVERSLGLLAHGGRFIEIGKTDVWSPERVAGLRPDVRYHVVDMAAVQRERPEEIGRALTDISARVERGDVAPLPFRTFPARSAAAAFRHMQRGEHIGKIVLTFADGAGPLRKDRTYLITGGLGGLGLSIAKRLAERGAGSLVLVGRRPPQGAALDAIAALRAAGAQVEVRLVDIGDPAHVRELFRAMDATLPKLAGVIHGAGVLSDAAIAHQSPASFAEAFGPKVRGAWLLHEHCRDRTLDFFVLHSSAASLLGSPGQMSHGAANAFMDALARARRAEGLPALSVGWGAWGAVGAAAPAHVQQKLRARGVHPLAPAEAIATLETLMESGTAYATVADIAWETWFAHRKRSPVLEGLARLEGEPGVSSQAPISDSERSASVASIVEREIAEVLGLGPTAKLDPRQGFFDLGMDSLTSVELRNRLQRSLAIVLPTTLTFDHPTPRKLIDHIVRDVLGVATEALPPPVASGFEDMSPNELAELLASELEQTKGFE